MIHSNAIILPAVSSAIPLPPPPPAIPAPPPVPPPPPSSHSSKGNHNPVASSSLLFSPALPSSGGADPSRDMLSQMQSRLRSRIKKKAAGRSGESSDSGVSTIDRKCLDIKVKRERKTLSRIMQATVNFHILKLII